MVCQRSGPYFNQPLHITEVGQNYDNDEWPIMAFFSSILALCPRVMPYLEPLFLSYCCCGHSACGKITLGKTNSLKRSKKL